MLRQNALVPSGAAREIVLVNDETAQAKLLQVGGCSVRGGVVYSNDTTRVHTRLQQTVNTLLGVVQAIVGGECNGVIKQGVYAC